MDVSTPSSTSTTSPAHPITAPSSPSKSKAVVTASSSGVQPRLLASDDINNASLRAHKSNLPLSLYLLSFAPPLRQKRQAGAPPSSWKETMAHPYVLYTLGTLAAIPAGLAFPALDMLYGYWTTGVTATTANGDVITSRGDQVGWIVTVIGFLILFFTWSFLALFSSASYHLTERLRHTYVASVMVQDAAFFEKVGPGEISTRASKDITAIRTAFGEKLGYLVWSTATIIAAISSSFANSPRLAGVLFCMIPFVVIIFVFLGWANEVVSAPANSLEGQTSSLAEQILSSVRIVQSFNMGEGLIKRFDGDLLKRLQKLGAKRSVIRSLEQSSVYFALFLLYSLAFWFGGIEVRGGLATGHVLTSFFNYVNLLFTFANVVPHLTSIADALVQLKELRRQIERQPFIDVRDESGIKLLETGWEPSFALENVTFAYPSRPTIPALNDVSVRIETGTVTAFVGPSGSGKSTTASLLLREYDPETANVPNKNDPIPEKTDEESDSEEDKGGKSKRKEAKGSTDVEKAMSSDDQEPPVKGAGKVYFAGRDIREYNLRWLRSQVAVVSQNPQLFSATVFENVAAGLTGTHLEYRPDIDGRADAPPETLQRTAAIRELCAEAMRKAEAWQFVSKLPEGMDTMIAGGRTGVLSGGQRQRLAIARALVRKPACMLLDEATSALDADTEEKIRVMLERELEERGMTIILIAHRLSTVAKAGRIIVMKEGRVVDQGTYAELMDKHRPDQTFRHLAITQRADPDIADNEVPEDSMDKEPPALDFETVGPIPTAPSGRAQTTFPTFSTSGTTAVDSDPVHHSGHVRPERLRKQSSQSRLKRPDNTWTVSGRGSTMFQHEHPTDDNGTMIHPTTSRTTAQTGDEDLEQPISPELGKEERRRSVRNFFKLLKSQRWFFIIGTVAGLVAGASFPIAGWMTGEAVNSLSDRFSRPGINTWSMWFLILAIIDLFIYFVNAFYLEVASENIMRKLKRDCLETLIKQEIGFFDQEDSSAGGLTSAVATHPANIGAATGLVSAQVLISVANLLGSLLMGLIIDWRLALVCSPPIVILFFSGWLNVAMLEKYESVTSVPSTKAAGYVNEVTDSIKTVAALGRERETMRVFDVQAKSAPKRTKYLILGAAGFANGQAMILLMAALIFYYASQRLASGAPVAKIFAVFEAVIIAAFSGSRLFTFVGDYGRAVHSFKAIQVWLRRKPKYSLYNAPTDEKIPENWSSGDIVLNHVEMRYPQRPNHPALKDISLRIRAGQTHAFCGTSGSGKSSILALLQRFYDPSRGTITFGGVDHRHLSLDDLRASMAYVSQDPVLFEGTIRWNMSLGALDASSVTDEQIKFACEQAYIWDFVCGLEKGLDTEIGMKGASLSGGQRQRLCIARALIRNPKILLLDEATSALDAQSEKSVQMALNNASKGRTTVTIAHRLSTIRRADVIHVIEDGYVRETGSHKELLRKRGRYFELVQAQL